MAELILRHSFHPAGGFVSKIWTAWTPQTPALALTELFEQAGDELFELEQDSSHGDMWHCKELRSSTVRRSLGAKSIVKERGYVDGNPFPAKLLEAAGRIP